MVSVGATDGVTPSLESASLKSVSMAGRQHSVTKVSQCPLDYDDVELHVLRCRLTY